MKKITFLLIVLIAVSVFTVLSNENSQSANKADFTELPSWSVTVHYEFGTGLVPGASVRIRLNGTGSDLFGSPQPTNSNGFVWFGNGGSYFPNGTYEVRVSKFGFGDGVTTVVIANGAPVYPITNVNIGTPE